MTTRTTIAFITLGACILLAGCGDSSEKRAADAKSVTEQKPAEQQAGAQREALGEKKTIVAEAVPRTYHKDIPVTVEYDWGDKGSSFAVAATATRTDTGEKISTAELKDIDLESKPSGEVTSTRVLVVADFLKDGKKVFDAEITVQLRRAQSGRLLKAIIDGKWQSDYSYKTEFDMDPEIVTKEIASGRIVSKATVEVDVQRSKGDEQGRIATVARAYRDASLGGAFGGPLAKKELPLAKETAVWKGTEVNFDKDRNVVFETRVLRNVGTGLLISERPAKGGLDVDYHHYEMIFLDWPMR